MYLKVLYLKTLFKGALLYSEGGCGIGEAADRVPISQSLGVLLLQGVYELRACLERTAAPELLMLISTNDGYYGYTSTQDGLHTCHGDLFSTAVEQISQLSAQVVAVCVNCTHPAYITVSPNREGGII